jgi:hypothetical protein
MGEWQLWHFVSMCTIIAYRPAVGRVSSFGRPILYVINCSGRASVVFTVQ